MTTSVDFMFVCFGISVIVVAVAVAIRLTFGSKKEKSDLRSLPPPPIVRDDVGGLEGRFEDIRKTRFASIVRDPTAGEPGGPRRLPPIRRLPLPPPLHPPIHENVVIDLPLKQRKSAPPPTEKD